MSTAEERLASILSEVLRRTGADVSLTPRGGEELPFSIVWEGEEITLYLAGSGEHAKETAKLIAFLLEGYDMRQASPDKRESLRAILLGEGGQWQAFRFLTKYNLADAPCFVVDLLPSKNLPAALAHVEGCIDGSSDLAVSMDDTRIAVVRFADEGQTPYEFGQFLVQSLYEETGIRARVGVGCGMNTFGEIAVSYNQAVTAVRMSGLLNAKGDVHSYREYLLVRMLEDVPRLRLKDYMEQFCAAGAEEIFEDEDMAETAEEFLESSLNVSETSRNLYMHRNTLMYRLDKIERATGLNIRKFSDAVTFRVITILYKLLQS